MPNENQYLEYSDKDCGNRRPQADDQQDAGNDNHNRNGRRQGERIADDYPEFMGNHCQSDQ